MLIYNVPPVLMDDFKGKKIVVRSADAAELAHTASRADAGNVVWLQLLSLASDCEPLTRLESPIPVDLVIERGLEEYPLLYEHAKLRMTRPVRVVIPLFPGFRKAVRLATSLSYSVKLDFDHADQVLGEELVETMNDYLHGCTVSTPIEYFHSMLVLFYHGHPTTMWTIQEEDPEFYRYVTDEGKVVVSRHVPHVPCEGQHIDFLEQIKIDLLLEKGECSICPFFTECHGYFRYVNRKRTCEVVKKIFHALRDTAEELKRDMAGALDASTGDRQ